MMPVFSPFHLHRVTKMSAAVESYTSASGSFVTLDLSFHGEDGEPTIISVFLSSKQLALAQRTAAAVNAAAEEPAVESEPVADLQSEAA